MTATTVSAPAARTPARAALRRFRKHPAALVSVVFIALVVLAAIFARPLSGHDPNAIDLLSARSGPSGAHLLGTDSTGRDVLSRLLFAGRISLGVGIASAAIAVVIGTVLGPSVLTMVIAIGLFQWPVCGRIVRGVTLSLREQEFVLASRATGAGPLWLMRKHIIPAALPPVSVVATLAVAQAIALEATLSFLGLGVQPPAASWGNMLTDAQSLTVIRSEPWLWLSPGIAVALTVLAVNFIGDGLRDAVDPRSSS